MLFRLENIEGAKVHATDGSIGKVRTFLFDDEKWVVRYVVTKHGFWVFGNDVLISPLSVDGTVDEGQAIRVKLTKDQIKNAPTADHRKPISRRKEEEFYRYHQLPIYWGGAGLWGTAMTPMEAGTVTYKPSAYMDEESSVENEDYHIRSTQEVIGYDVQAAGEKVGKVGGFVIEGSNWAVRYIRIEAKDTIGGGNLYVSPHWVDDISWIEADLKLDIGADRLMDVPVVGTTGSISREEEEKLHDFFQQPRYWK
ncbi:MAG: PRC-barrel domain-containing protein [Spirochaetales bacterium]